MNYKTTKIRRIKTRFNFDPIVFQTEMKLRHCVHHSNIDKDLTVFFFSFFLLLLFVHLTWKS